MPRYSNNNSLQLSGLRSVFSPDLCVNDGQEDFDNSEHSGRWTGGSIVVRKKLWTDDTAFAPNTAANEMIMQLPVSPNWGFYIVDAIVQAKINTGGTGGAIAFSLGTLEAPSYTSVISGPSVGPLFPAAVQTWRVNTLDYGLAPGLGGRAAFRTYRPIYLRMDNSGFATLNNSPIVVTLFGYLLPDATVENS